MFQKIQVQLSKMCSKKAWIVNSVNMNPFLVSIRHTGQFEYHSTRTAAISTTTGNARQVEARWRGEGSDYRSPAGTLRGYPPGTGAKTTKNWGTNSIRRNSRFFLPIQFLSITDLAYNLQIQCEIWILEYFVGIILSFFQILARDNETKKKQQKRNY